MPLDARFDVTDLLVDRRATHFGDNEQLVWDAFLVFGPEATWEADPPEPLGHRSPVVEYMATLTSLLQPYLQ